MRSTGVTGKIAVCALAALTLSGCVRPHETEDERIRRQSADAAKQVRQDAQNAGVEARKAALQAGREAREIVAGVREGWRDGAPPPKNGDAAAAKLDLNTATAAQLSTLPGISSGTARRIVSRRPYRDVGDLVRRKVLSEAEYDDVEDRVVVRHASHATSD